jgi:hypothetical protein
MSFIISDELGENRQCTEIVTADQSYIDLEAEKSNRSTCTVNQQNDGIPITYIARRSG